MKYIFFAFTLLISPSFFAHAQVDLSLTENSAVIVTEPAYPEPLQTFTAKLDDYSITSVVSSISWRVNGTAIAGANNTRSITIEAGEAGEAMVVEAVLSLSGGGTMIARKEIVPLYLDLIVEPQTKTPSFYLGRGLPSIGSFVQVTALVHGDQTNASDFLYTWRVNNQVIEGGALRGKNSTLVTVPVGRVFLVTVEVSKLTGGTLIRKTVELPSVSPEILFYESNSLYGTKNKAFTSLNLIGDSATVKAEPYHLDIRTYNNPSHLEWSLNGVRSATPEGNPYEITFARSEALLGGATRAGLHVRNLNQLLQGAEAEFQINF